MLDIVELSRLQFALTAMYHFLFVPLTLGMAFLLAIMETVYVLSGKQIYKDMTKFWGKDCLVSNFALGVATGLTMGSVQDLTGLTIPTNGKDIFRCAAESKV